MMNCDIEKRLCSGIRSLDKLRFKAAGSRTGSITVSIEELNAIRWETDASRQELERLRGVIRKYFKLKDKLGVGPWFYDVTAEVNLRQKAEAALRDEVKERGQ